MFSAPVCLSGGSRTFHGHIRMQRCLVRLLRRKKARRGSVRARDECGENAFHWDAEHGFSVPVSPMRRKIGVLSKNIAYGYANAKRAACKHRRYIAVAHFRAFCMHFSGNAAQARATAQYRAVCVKESCRVGAVGSSSRPTPRHARKKKSSPAQRFVRQPLCDSRHSDLYVPF